jgi:hypothetical protein
MSSTTHRLPNETFAGYSQLAVEVCCTCGVMFAMPEVLRKEALADHSRSFYCPNGHGQHFLGKTDEQKLKELLEREKENMRWMRDHAARVAAERDQAKAQARAQKGANTRLKKRIAAGVCPCCKRSFRDLARHMHGQHPEFVESESA